MMKCDMCYDRTSASARSRCAPRSARARRCSSARARRSSSCARGRRRSTRSSSASRRSRRKVNMMVPRAAVRAAPARRRDGGDGRAAAQPHRALTVIAAGVAPATATDPFAEVEVCGRSADAVDAIPSIARIDSPAREGLTGTTPASIYRPRRDREQITIPPDGRPLERAAAWRQDFPIDWPQDHYVARRDFTKFLVLTSCAFARRPVLDRRRRTGCARRRGQPPIAAHRVARRARRRRRRSSSTIPASTTPACWCGSPTSELVAYSQKCTHLSCAVIPQTGRGHAPLPVPRGLLRPADRARRSPARRAARCRASCSRSADDDIYATGVEERTI